MLAPSARHEPKFQTPAGKAGIRHKPSPLAEGFVGVVPLFPSVQAEQDPYVDVHHRVSQRHEFR